MNGGKKYLLIISTRYVKECKRTITVSPKNLIIDSYTLYLYTETDNTIGVGAGKKLCPNALK